MRYIYVCLLIPILALPINSFNYLIYSPLFAHSHSTFLAKIANSLADAGHNVTFFCPIVDEKYRNVKYVQPKVRVVYMEPEDTIVESFRNIKSDFSLYWKKDSSFFEMVPTFKSFLTFTPICMKYLRNNIEVLDQMKNTKYDVVISEQFQYASIAIQEYLQIPTIIPVTSITHDPRLCEVMGEGASPTYLAGGLVNYSNDMTFFQRFFNAFVYLFEHVELQSQPIESFVHPGKYIHFEDFSKAPVVFYNSNPIIDFPRPILPKTVLVGGITINIDELKSKKVNEEFDKILNERPHTILVSFGSLFLAKDMPMSYKSNLAKVMGSFPNVTFIWKYETSETEFASGIENIHFRQWVPQPALLADPRLSAFFTHAGLGSVNELSYLGKPAIVCPIFGDQTRNAKMLVRHNGSIEISKFDLPKFEVVHSAIDNILNDMSYKQNAKILAEKLEKQPIKPKDLLVKYAEFAAEFGEQPLSDPYYNKLSFIQYFLIDVAFVYLILIVTILIVIHRVFRYLLRYFVILQKKKTA